MEFWIAASSDGGGGGMGSSDDWFFSAKDLLKEAKEVSLSKDGELSSELPDSELFDNELLDCEDDINANDGIKTTDNVINNM